MWSSEIDARWRELAEEAMSRMKEWRLVHPKATLAEIEAALDERLEKVRARMLEDAAQVSAAADIAGAKGEEPPRCPECRAELKDQGQGTRAVTTKGNQTINLRRSYGLCPSCGARLSPLDEELGLLPGSLAPSLVESVVLLGAWIPFEPAAELLAHFTRGRTGEATARRGTEEAGAAYVALQTKELERLERETPMAPAGPAVQQLSVDGAMVPLLHKDWAEVKTLAIGVVRQRLKTGEMGPHTEEISYFSRLADHLSFARLAFVETHRRGTARAAGGAGAAAGRRRGAGGCEGKPGVPGEAGRADPLCRVPGSRIPHRQRERGECQQAGGGDEAQRGWDALGEGTRGPHAGS